MANRRIGCERLYNREFAQRGIEGVVLWDVLMVAEGEVIRVVFESANPERPQGLWLRTDRGLDIAGQRCPSASLWYDAAPREAYCTCHTTDGCLSVYNVFEYQGQRMSQTRSTGMLVEELDSGRRYRCNDLGFDTAFDSLVFRIERLG